MNATINLEKHFPVLLNELVSIISPLYGGTFIDCTFGGGGYSKKILENNLNNKDTGEANEASNTLSNETFEETSVSEANQENIDFRSETDEHFSEKNGLENFELSDDDTPELFNAESNEEVISSPEEMNTDEEEDLEIPAFLRRQKN